MRKPFAAMLALVLLLGGLLPGARLASPQTASAYNAPPPPTLPLPTLSPARLDTSSGSLPALPPPDNLPPEGEEARVRQAAQAVLDKYAQYYGPRYAMTVTEVAVEGEWAYAVAEPEGVGGESLTLLAHQETGGEWQALMPDSDGLYLQWVDAVPESLMPAVEKSQLRVQANEADVMVQSGVTLPAEIMMVPGTVAMDDEVEAAVRQALLNAYGILLVADYYSVSDVQAADRWLFISVVGLGNLNSRCKTLVPEP